MPVTFRRNDPLRGTVIEKSIGDALRIGWAPLGEKLVSWLKEKSPVYKGKYRDSHKFKVRGTGLKTELRVYSSDKLGKWKDHGRESGKFPPPPAMLAYVRKRGLVIAGSNAPIKTQQKSIAFLIGRKISKGDAAYGPTRRPNFYPERVVRENRSEISSQIKHLSAAIAAMLNR